MKPKIIFFLVSLYEEQPKLVLVERLIILKQKKIIMYNKIKSINKCRIT